MDKYTVDTTDKDEQQAIKTELLNLVYSLTSEDLSEILYYDTDNLDEFYATRELLHKIILKTPIGIQEPPVIDELKKELGNLFLKHFLNNIRPLAVYNLNRKL